MATNNNNQNLETKETREVGGTEPTRAGRVYTPRVDIYETGDRLVLLADMPGVDTDDLDIRVESDELTIHGRVDETPVEGHQPAWREYGQGDYHRTFLLPEEVDTEKIDATLKQGVLRLELPKAESAKPRKIEVKSAEGVG